MLQLTETCSVLTCLQQPPLAPRWLSTCSHLCSWTAQQTVWLNARHCCRPVHVWAQPGHCALQVGQENALLIVFEVCKATHATSLICQRRRVACNLPQIQSCAHSNARQETQISPWSLLPFIFFFFFFLPLLFLFRRRRPRNNCFGICLPLSVVKEERGRVRRGEKSHYDSSGNCRTIENWTGEFAAN